MQAHAVTKRVVFWASAAAPCAAGASQPTSLLTGAAKPPVCACTRKRSRRKKSRRLCRCATRPSTPACRHRKSCHAWQTRGSTWPLSRAFTGCSKSTDRSTQRQGAPAQESGRAPNVGGLWSQPGLELGHHVLA
jgi:hypothetical protein